MRAQVAMKWLRYLMLLASVGWLAFFLYNFRTFNGLEAGISTSMFAFLVFNIFYLLSSRPAQDHFPSRLSRLLSLWLDAKEHELRERAKDKPSDTAFSYRGAPTSRIGDRPQEQAYGNNRARNFDVLKASSHGANAPKIDEAFVPSFANV